MNERTRRYPITGGRERATIKLGTLDHCESYPFAHGCCGPGPGTRSSTRCNDSRLTSTQPAQAG
eukprot:6062772-Alexandrium_andersonii.AAC.1